MSKTRVSSYILASLAFAGIALFGCSDSWQEAYPQTEEQASNDTEINILTSVFPSPKEQNPYSVENMNKIFKSLVLANNPDAEDIPELEANFLYVRFLPYGKQGVHELKTYDTALVLFKHPMDYNEIRKPVVYIDKTLPDSIIPYFAAVPVGYEFGPTPYEILQELFLTQPLEEDGEDSQKDSRFVRAKRANRANKDIAAYLQNQDLTPSLLEMVAFPNSERFNTKAGSDSSKVLAKNISIDTDNIVAWSWKNLLPWNWKNVLPSRWRPSGTLKYYDDYLKEAMPLVGVRVIAGYFYYWRESHTDANGYFQSPDRWTFSVDYEANFDSHQFLLQDGHTVLGWDLEIERSNKKSAWIETFEGNEAIWCVVWTAAWNYWYGNRYGLERPRLNTKNPFVHSLEINVYYKNATDWNEAFGRYKTSSFQEYIMILAYGREHIEIYGTTVHEIAHSSHYGNGNYFTFSPKILKETYARGIQRYLSIKYYEDWSKAFYDSIDTGLFEDLEDTNSTYAQRIKKYCDRVSGITAPMAEAVLFMSDSWDGFRDNLMKAYPSGTPNNENGTVAYFAADMIALFYYWETGIGASCPRPIADTRDGKTYRTVTMGTQTWMAENLNYNASGSKCGIGGTSGATGTFSDTNTTTCDAYGRLYDWSTAMALPSSCNSATCSGQVNAKHQGVCPNGWRIPSNADWDKLMRYVDGTNGTNSPYDSPMAGKYLKATSGWKDFHNNNISGYINGNGVDYYGFSALPGGYGYSGGFKNVGYNGDWWSASEYDSGNAYRLDIYGGDKAGWEDIDGNRKHSKSDLFSVRCVKD
ncbi:MAG: hypothetical protein LBC64_00590 [Fibromonadaceae bacterium]|jgi:uncharacterized protein (TIGR02145 family)|nr:hypothetical protein [Fibromonadaceae bacterium]